MLLETDTAMKTSDTTDELALTQLLAQAGILQSTGRAAPRPR
jgi:hypothetical protein